LYIKQPKPFSRISDELVWIELINNYIIKFLLTFYFLDFQQLRVCFFIRFCEVLEIIHFSFSRKISFEKLKNYFRTNSYMST